MISLHDMSVSHEALKAGLQENAMRHRCYSMYTSMERAMSLLLTGNLYITNGQTWNDMPDRVLMKNNLAYGICFSCSTLENIAMWMLYSGDHGKNGAMIQFPPSVINEIVNTQEIEIGCFNEQGKFVPSEPALKKSAGDYEIFMTDVIYTDFQKKKQGELQTVILSCREDHQTVPAEILSGSDVFHKHYAWSYEKECRLIVRPRVTWDQTEDASAAHATIRIRLSDKARNALRERVVRSPVLQSKVDFGNPSMLVGKIDWSI